MSGGTACIDPTVAAVLVPLIVFRQRWAQLACHVLVSYQVLLRHSPQLVSPLLPTVFTLVYRRFYLILRYFYFDFVVATLRYPKKTQVGGQGSVRTARCACSVATAVMRGGHSGNKKRTRRLEPTINTRVIASPCRLWQGRLACWPCETRWGKSAQLLSAFYCSQYHSAQRCRKHILHLYECKYNERWCKTATVSHVSNCVPVCAIQQQDHSPGI